MDSKTRSGCGVLATTPDLHLGGVFRSRLPNYCHFQSFATRSRWRWPVKNYLEGGAVQLQCPQCAGGVKTSAKTRKTNATPNKNPVPFLAIDDEYCCEGLATVPVEDLDSYQRNPLQNPRMERGIRPAQHQRDQEFDGRRQRQLRTRMVPRFQPGGLHHRRPPQSHSTQPRRSHPLPQNPTTPHPRHRTEPTDTPTGETHSTSDESPRAPP